MAYRYCPDCDRWLATSEYTVDESGETICPKPEHRAVHGFIGGGIETAAQLRHELQRSYSDVEDELDAAKRQGLVS